MLPKSEGYPDPLSLLMCTKQVIRQQHSVSLWYNAKRDKRDGIFSMSQFKEHWQVVLELFDSVNGYYYPLDKQGYLRNKLMIMMMVRE